jgi:2-keto-4-pentenoate hydratase/2-oxohepta-3-ene-1,7-dioic acid hydratase in catechol pathway
MDGVFGQLKPAAETPFDVSEVRLLTPTMPQKIACAAPNYKATFGGHPIPFVRSYIWLKPSSAILDPDGVIELPPGVPMVVHESELAIVIGKTAKNVNRADAHDYIFGYTCINDVTAGKLTNPPEFLASQYFVDGKIFDTFGPFGPCIETELDPSDIKIECRVNGEVRQDHRTSDMIWSVPELVEQFSQVLTLYPGDIIATGSPPGPGPLKDGDVVEVTVEGIGTLRNTVRNKTVG